MLTGPELLLLVVTILLVFGLHKLPSISSSVARVMVGSSGESSDADVEVRDQNGEDA